MSQIFIVIEQLRRKLQSESLKILDVRTAEEWSNKIIEGSQLLSLSDIIQNNFSTLTKSQRYAILCKSGDRSIQAYEHLLSHGFKDICIIEGGIDLWKQKGLPVIDSKIADNELRYQRHHQLKGFGRKAQDKLAHAKVAIVGVGGLGSSAAYYLAAAGVGQLTLIDEDKVCLSNLQRQIIHSTKSINHAKVESAQETLKNLNPEITVNTIKTRLNQENIASIIKQVDVVVDGTDNLKTRYLINDYCQKLQKKLVYAAVFEYETQLTSFDFIKEKAPCLRCLFPEQNNFESKNCSATGVLGVVPGVAGVLQANEVIKLITGVGKPLLNRFNVINMLDNSFNSFTYKISRTCLNKH